MEQDLFGESSVEEDSSSTSSSSSDDDDEEEQQQSLYHQQDGGQQLAATVATPSPGSSPLGRDVEGDSQQQHQSGGDEGDISTQLLSTQDLFGASSSPSSSSTSSDVMSTSDRDDDAHAATATTAASPSHGELGQVGGDADTSQTIQGLFGDAAELSSSSSDDDDDEIGSHVRGSGRPLDQSALTTEREEEEEEEVPRIDVEIPRCVAQLGSEPYFIKLPNFLSIETRPFDEAVYEDETEDDGEVLDEDGRARLKLKVENTVRWRYALNEDGEEVKESNSRIVRWSDGSMSLYLGGEIFDIYKQSLQGEYSHLFVRQGTGLQGQSVFRSKLTFRPHSTDSQTHRKMTLSIADRFSKAQKIRVLPVVGKDPESQRSEMIKREEQRLKASVRLENQRKRSREKEVKQSITAGYLEGGNYDDELMDEEEEEEEEEGTSLKAIKKSVRSRLHERRDRESDSEEEGAREERLLQAKHGERKRGPVQSSVTAVKKKGRKLVLSDDDDDEEDEEEEEEEEEEEGEMTAVKKKGCKLVLSDNDEEEREGESSYV